jgi:hypothetical protein
MLHMRPFAIFFALSIIAIVGCKKTVTPAIVVVAGADQTIQIPLDSTTLTGSASTNNEAAITYAWSQVSGPTSATIASSASASTVVRALKAGAYSFQLKATSSAGPTAFDTVVVTVKAHNVPTVSAGPDRTIELPKDTVILNGSGAGSAPGIVIATYAWTQISGPGTATIATASGAVTSMQNLKLGVYNFQLKATDNFGLSVMDTVVVTVTSAPITLTMQPANNPNERMLVSIGGIDQSFTGTTEWIIDAWTVGGKPYLGRVAVKFDMSAIPSTATIVSANLFLYSNAPPENGNLIDANFGTNNSLLVQRITAAWTPASTTMNNLPAITSTDQVSIPHTSSSVLDLNVDVKTLVSTMVTGGNHGFFIKLQNETAFTSRQFVSSFHATKTDKRPKLVVVYK